MLRMRDAARSQEGHGRGNDPDVVVAKWRERYPDLDYDTASLWTRMRHATKALVDASVKAITPYDSDHSLRVAAATDDRRALRFVEDAVGGEVGGRRTFVAAPVDTQRRDARRENRARDRRGASGDDGAAHARGTASAHDVAAKDRLTPSDAALTGSLPLRA